MSEKEGGETIEEEGGGSIFLILSLVIVPVESNEEIGSLSANVDVTYQNYSSFAISNCVFILFTLSIQLSLLLSLGSVNLA